MKTIRTVLSLIGMPVIAASLCCLSPIIIVLFGVGSVAFASSLADTLYLSYKWYFRAAGLILLILSIVLYYRKQGICTLDQAKRRQKEILNTVLVSVFTAIVGYIFFLYVVVHYIGVFLQIWQ